MPVDIDEYIQQQEREQVKDKRRGFWRAKEGIEQVEEDHEDYDLYHWNYHAAVRSWVWRIHAAVNSAAEEGIQPFQDIWLSREFGEYEGLESVFEGAFMGDTEDPLPTQTLDEIGATLDSLCVASLDLPEQRPVVGDPWDPSEMMTAEEFQEKYDELMEEVELDDV